MPDFKIYKGYEKILQSIIEAITGISTRKHCLISAFGQEKKLATLTIQNDNRHSFPIRCELKNVKYLISHHSPVEVSFCLSRCLIIQQIQPCKTKRPNFGVINLPALFPLLLTRTICKFAAALTRASSSQDWALYKTDPLGLEEVGQSTRINDDKNEHKTWGETVRWMKI